MNHRDRAVMAVKDAYSTARICGMAHRDLLARIAEIRATIAHCPRWVGSYVEGVDRTLSDALYSDSLMFGGMVDGRFYSTHSARPDYYQKHGFDPAEWADDGRVTARGHYWATTSTPRPFFVPTEESSK